MNAFAKLLTVEEAAAYLRVSEETVRRYIRDNRIAAIKVGRGYRIKVSELEAFLSKLAEPSEEPKGGSETEDQDDWDVRAWLDAGAEALAERLEILESEIPPEELRDWKEAMARAAKPVRYVPGKGLVFLEGGKD